MQKKVLGDFQTPLTLARAVVQTLEAQGYTWGRVLEPTCGVGNFIQASQETHVSPVQTIGVELQPAYAEEARRRFEDHPNVIILNRDIFSINLTTEIHWHTDAPLLVIGNPPWVTNAMMGALEGDNLPQKSNFKNMRGIDAITGQSNFDIAEFIILQLLRNLQTTPAILAMLCKTSVARHVITTARKEGLPICSISMHRIDSMSWFGAAVDACLFSMLVNQGEADYRTAIYPFLDAVSPEAVLGFSNERMIADSTSYERVKYLDSQTSADAEWVWRAGVKHDAASVIELRHVQENLVNGYGDVVEVEEEFVFPLLKSSDIQRFDSRQLDRSIIITQKAVGESTRHFETHAPRLWSYLQKHKAIFTNRKSSIYQKKPPFSIFGVGDYTFAPYKVIVSGFYKEPRFIAVGTLCEKPIICDDTCYLLPQSSAYHAAIVAAVLNSTQARTFFKSIAFKDSKRPYTKSVLSRLNIQSLITELSAEELQLGANQEISRYFPGTTPIESPKLIREICDSLLRQETNTQYKQLTMF